MAESVEGPGGGPNLNLDNNPDGQPAPDLDLERKLGHLFARPGLLDQALRHSSFAFEQPGDEQGDNERLEYLGDAVLELVISDKLYRMLPQAGEGRLTAIRAGLVNERALASLAREMGLGAHIRLGRGEAAGGGADKPSILSDCLEAVLGAVFLDSGIEAARRVIINLWAKKLDKVGRGRIPKDAKTRLQEQIQADLKSTPTYRVVGSRGPDHDRVFVAEVLIDGQPAGRGSGSSKKEAEQEAARAVLEQFNKKSGPGTGGQ